VGIVAVPNSNGTTEFAAHVLSSRHCCCSNRLAKLQCHRVCASLLVSASHQCYCALWLQVFGYDCYDGAEASQNGMIYIPQVLTCPEGEYIVQVRPQLLQCSAQLTH
jgi:hypothetical protein